MICFYGEFDPFTGTVPPTLDLLPSVVRRLKLLLAACERVIIAPGSMLEHALALPVMEALAPMVRAGLMTTSVHHDSPSPVAWLDERIAQQMERVPAEGRRAGTSRGHFRRDELVELVERWQAILPDQWSVVRDVPLIVDGYGEQVRHRLATLAATRSGREAQALVDLIDRLRDSGRVVPDRNRLLAAMVRVRERMPRLGAQRAASLIQGVYFKQGTSSDAKWVVTSERQVAARLALYPGLFVRTFARVAGPFGGDLPVAWHLAPGRLVRRMRHLGLAPEVIARVPGVTLRDLIVSGEWAVVREALGEEMPGAERVALARERVRALGVMGLGARCVVEFERRSTAPTLAPDDWTLAVTGGLGSTSAVMAPAGVVLDPWGGELHGKGGVARLGHDQARLVAVLAAAGPVGVAHDQVDRTMRELDVIACDDDVRPPALRPRRDQAARLRVDVAVHRLAGAVAGTGLALGGGRGRWRLDGGVRLTGTVWSEGSTVAAGAAGAAGAAVAAAPTAPALPPTLRRVWDALAAHHPEGCTLDMVAGVLGLEGDRVRAAQVVSRLAARLRGEGARWRVEGVGQRRSEQVASRR